MQTIATKFRQEKEDDRIYPNLMRQYYDISCLLDHEDVRSFIGTEAYYLHKGARFRGKKKDIIIKESEAFLLEDRDQRQRYKDRYTATSALYYSGQPDFETVLAKIHAHIERL